MIAAAEQHATIEPYLFFDGTVNLPRTLQQWNAYYGQRVGRFGVTWSFTIMA